MTHKGLKRWLPLAALLAALGAGGTGTAQAEPCVAEHDGTNPDASVTDSSACGPGIVGTNDNATTVQAAENVTPDALWGLVARDNDESFSVDGISFTTTGTTSGTWSFTTSGLFNLDDFQYLLVIKDGKVDNNTPTWFWFIIDEAASCTGSSCSGEWTMYGENGRAKEVSHLSLYAAGDEGGPPPIEIDLPEPGALLLLGGGLLGLWASRRRAV